MGKIAAGQLTERIELRESSAVPPQSDGRGGFQSATTAPAQTVWASKRQASGTELLRLGQTLASDVVVFTIRHRRSLTATALVRWEGRSYAIQQVVHDDRREFTVLTCINNGRG